MGSDWACNSFTAQGEIQRDVGTSFQGRRGESRVEDEVVGLFRMYGIPTLLLVVSSCLLSSVAILPG